MTEVWCCRCVRCGRLWRVIRFWVVGPIKRQVRVVSRLAIPQAFSQRCWARSYEPFRTPNFGHFSAFYAIYPYDSKRLRRAAREIAEADLRCMLSRMRLPYWCLRCAWALVRYSWVPHLRRRFMRLMERALLCLFLRPRATAWASLRGSSLRSS